MAAMEISDAAVLRAMRAATGDPAARLLAWSNRTLGGGATGETGISDGVRRISGTAMSKGHEVGWSTILKVLRDARFQLDADTEVPTTDPSGWAYWHREADLYTSGLLGVLDDPDGLVAPRCFAVDEAEGEVALWLEDISDEGPAVWPLARYGLAARHLGRFNGAYLVGRPMPDYPWLSSGRITAWLGTGAGGISKMRLGRDTDFLAQWLSDESVTRTEHLWDRRHELLDALWALPITLCHHDAGRRNLVARQTHDGERIGAIDWQMTGRGHLGEEPAVLLAVSLQFLDVPSAQIAALERVVLDGYVDGLRAVGWHGDAATVRFGFAIAASLLLGVGGAGAWFTWIRHTGTPIVERIVGRPVDDIATQWSELQPYLLDLGEEALATIEDGRR